MNGKMKIMGLKKRLLLTGGLLLIIILMFGLRDFPELVEKYYSSSVYPYIRNSLQFIFNLFPFSIGDLFYILIIISLAAGIVRIFRHSFNKRFREAAFVFLGLIFYSEIAFIIFYLFWGLNYFREPASKRLVLENPEYKKTELLAISSMLVDSMNSSRAALRSEDLQSALYQGSIRAVQKLSESNPFFRTADPLVKSSLFSSLLNYMGTSGYYNPFTGEAQVNNQMPVFLKPFVACHEMAHQTGYGAEDEASFVGFISGKNSEDRLLKYSSYYAASQEFLAEVWRSDSLAFKLIKARISEPVLNDLKAERAFWTKYQGNAAELSSIFYDNYLKINKQPEGLKTYNRMIKLTMAYYKKKGLVKDPVF